MAVDINDKNIEITFKGIRYVWNPDAFSIGLFQFHKSEKRGSQFPKREIQLQLNKIVFGKSNLPDLVEKIKKLNQSEEMKKSLGFLQLKIASLKSGGNFPDSISPNNRRFKTGDLFLFKYDAKHKDKLEYWDMFPLIIPFNFVEDRLYGINFHYLPIPLRVRVMQKLLPLAFIDNEQLRLRVTWELLKMAIPKECLVMVHCYLKDHIRSRILTVSNEEWAKIIFLPVQKFVGPNNKSVSSNKVWSDSKSRMTS